MNQRSDETIARLEVAEGAHVYASDGVELGTLAEVREGYFKVEVSLGPDYWLPFDTVARNEGNDVYLNLDQREVDSRKLDAAAEDLLKENQAHDLDEPLHGAGAEQRYRVEGGFGFHPRPRI